MSSYKYLEDFKLYNCPGLRFLVFKDKEQKNRVRIKDENNNYQILYMETLLHSIEFPNTSTLTKVDVPYVKKTSGMFFHVNPKEGTHGWLESNYSH